MEINDQYKIIRYSNSIIIIITKVEWKKTISNVDYFMSLFKKILIK